ncbi:Exostosin family protein [Euphorbia peplus]|nr:Exostosin family protein [Euphorbia peplus]
MGIALEGHLSTCFFFSCNFLLTIFFFFSSSSQSQNFSNSNPPPKPQTSFLTSLEQFLAAKSAPKHSDDTVVEVRDDDVLKLDERMFLRESERLYGSPYYPFDFLIRVYVYEMPRRFTYDLLLLFRNSYRDSNNLISNGSPVHRLIEQHSVDYWLWADLIAPESDWLLKSVVRVQRQEEADLFYFRGFAFWLLFPNCTC